MAIAFVSSAKNTATGTTTVAVNLTVTAGDLIVVGATAAMANINSVADGTNTYTANGRWDMGVVFFQGYFTQAANSGTITITVTAAGSTNLTMVAQNFSGFTSPAKDKTTFATGTSTSPNSGNTAATTGSTELLVGIGTWGSGGGAATIGAGYNNLDQNNATTVYSGMESQVVNSTGTYSATLTIASASWSMGIITFKETGVAVSSPSYVLLAGVGIF